MPFDRQAGRLNYGGLQVRVVMEEEVGRFFRKRRFEFIQSLLAVPRPSGPPGDRALPLPWTNETHSSDNAGMQPDRIARVLRRRMLALAMALLAVTGGTHGEALPERVVVLTFDDSVRSQYTVVRPLLKKLGFSATFFITEGFDFRTNKKDYMTWEQIRELHEDGFEIGNHTRDHLGVTERTLNRLPEQIEAINAQCRRHGIPQPVSFAYPGNAFVFKALPILAKAGFKFARRGGSPEYPYDKGNGVAYEPGKDHPLLIPTAGDARPDWTIEDFKRALARGKNGGIPVLQFHGVPDRQHPWVHTPPERFKKYMTYLKERHYQVLALRDLERFIDPSQTPKDPGAILKERLDRIRGRTPSQTR